LLTSLYPPCPVRETLSVVLVPYRCHSLQRGQINGSTRRRRLLAAAGCCRGLFRWRTAPPIRGRGQRCRHGRTISARIERPRWPHRLQSMASVGPCTSDRVSEPSRGMGANKRGIPLVQRFDRPAHLCGTGADRSARERLGEGAPWRWQWSQGRAAALD
jgi:hypothetical protein